MFRSEPPDHKPTSVIDYVIVYRTLRPAVSPVKTSKPRSEGPLWQQMVQPHWERFAGLLDAIPTGMQRTARADIDHAVEQLADEFDNWFQTLGFTLDDIGGQFAFYITDWTLLDTA